MKKAEKKLSLVLERQLFWKQASEENKKEAYSFAEGYKKFLDSCKTERETVVFTEKVLSKKGFIEVLSKKGNKVYRSFRNKTIAFAIIGSEPIEKGVNIVASHVDAPRVDLKQHPLYEDGNTQLAMMKTHYYGGIKKYQWVSTPLSLHGVVIKSNGEKVDICIGENDKDPVFVMPDLLPHLARKEQYGKLLPEGVDASKMNLIFSSMPSPDPDAKEAMKQYALEMLNQKYGMKEADFISAELQLVPAGKARDCGMDSSMVLGYGQDDRICAYTSLQALLDLPEKQVKRTTVVYFSDKEEIGSDGATGAASIFLMDFIGDLLKHNGENADSYSLRKAFMNSLILSADVTAAVDPNYPGVHDKQNSVLMGYGVGISKFTGSGGKYGSNDADSEFTAKIIQIFTDANIPWQMGELGKVDEGGGGTIAKFLAANGAQVIDCGTALLGMHSLYELCSKADLYNTFKAYREFMLKA